MFGQLKQVCPAELRESLVKVAAGLAEIYLYDGRFSIWRETASENESAYVSNSSCRFYRGGSRAVEVRGRATSTIG